MSQNIIVGFVCVSAVFLVCFGNPIISTKPLLNQLLDDLDDCKTKHNVNNEELRNITLLEKKKCFTQCVLEKMGVLNDGYYNVDIMIEANNLFQSGDERTKLHEQLMQLKEFPAIPIDCNASYAVFYSTYKAILDEAADKKNAIKKD